VDQLPQIRAACAQAVPLLSSSAWLAPLHKTLAALPAVLAEPDLMFKLPVPPLRTLCVQTVELIATRVQDPALLAVHVPTTRICLTAFV